MRHSLQWVSLGTLGFLKGFYELNPSFSSFWRRIVLHGFGTSDGVQSAPALHLQAQHQRRPLDVAAE